MFVLHITTEVKCIHNKTKQMPLVHHCKFNVELMNVNETSDLLEVAYNLEHFLQIYNIDSPTITKKRTK